MKPLQMKCFRFHVGVIQPPTSSYTKYTSLYIFDVLLPRQATNKFQVGDQFFDVFFFNVSDNLESRHLTWQLGIRPSVFLLLDQSMGLISPMCLSLIFPSNVEIHPTLVEYIKLNRIA